MKREICVTVGKRTKKIYERPKDGGEEAKESEESEET